MSACKISFEILVNTKRAGCNAKIPFNRPDYNSLRKILEKCSEMINSLLKMQSNNWLKQFRPKIQEIEARKLLLPVRDNMIGVFGLFVVQRRVEVNSYFCTEHGGKHGKLDQ